MAHGRSSRVRRWLHEPLLQFLLIGAALFAGWQLLHGDDARDSRVIELTQDDLKQMTVGWLAQGLPAPSPEQMRSLVENKVREEVLYREALALGLDRDDTIVKRRLAQKMDFLADDTVAIREPTDDELRTWYAAHAARFEVPSRATFRHVYFSPDRRGAHAQDDAAAALAAVTGSPGSQPAGDAFMFQDRFSDRTPEQVSAMFGPAFATALFRLKAGGWQGPIQSGYGWHLVEVDAMAPAQAPAFEAVEPAIREAWVDEHREASKRRAYDAMRARYDVVLPAGDRIASVRRDPDAEGAR
jgi:hypothetical protein